MVMVTGDRAMYQWDVKCSQGEGGRLERHQGGLCFCRCDLARGLDRHLYFFQ